MGEAVRLPVRELVAFLMQSGSIDNRFGGPERAAEGSRIHRRLQREAGPGYRAEVPLSRVASLGDVDYLLEGRADGVFQEGDLLVVEEIKSTGAPIEMVTEDFNRAHWGQARCYAWILTAGGGLPEAAVQLTYCQADTGELKRFRRIESAAALDAFVRGLLAAYRRWAEFRLAWSGTRTESIRGLSFPFPAYRGGQRRLAGAVYRVVRDRRRMFCQAPTGVGKTMSTLFPSVKAMGEGLAERIFYLTAKTVARQAAEEAYERMRAGGLRMKTVTLTAKDKICFLEERDCNPVACPYAAGYYDRAREGVYGLLTSADAFSRERIEEEARRLRLCPFELSLDLSLWCDGIICDYNYLFDPTAALQRFFADRRGEYVFLIDEAHNLPGRAREMYSADLVKSRFLALKKSLGRGGGELRGSVRELNAQLVGVRRDCVEAERGAAGEPRVLVREKPGEALCRAVSRFSLAASAWLEEHREPGALRAEVLERFFEASFYLRILELFDDHYRVFDTVQGGETVTRLFCLDPSRLLDKCLKKGRAAVFFSATLSPPGYYREVLGGGEDALLCAAASPFPPENLCLLCAAGVSTLYRDRPGSLEPIAGLLAALVAGRRGNYLAFFPSYRYLRDVFEVFQERYPGVETVVQTGEMDEAGREAFLARFCEDNPCSLLGFCVLGGVFGEGVDLPGERLIGAAVVGVGLPQICPEIDLLRAYYEEKNGAGYDYAYRFPGMNKVLQAAGRVVRGAGDRGVVLLIDSRFPSRAYQCLFPAHWANWQRVADAPDLARRLALFWRG